MLLLFLVLIGIGVLVFRLSGSGAEISRRTNFFSNPFTLLFEPNGSGTTTPPNGMPFPYPDSPEIPLDDALGSDSDNANVASTRVELAAIEGEYDTLNRRILDAKDFGSPSPYRGLVYIDESYGGVSADEPALEYVILTADAENGAPISISGWSLQSIVQHTRAYIPQGARVLTAHRVPNIAAMQLDPGNRAIISSGHSPVGVSFKENLCTGYLGQFQTFVPSLEERCPTPEKEVSSEPATARTNDPYCVSFANSIPQCHFYVGEPPQNVTPPCFSFVRNELTFAGCTARHSWRPSYLGDTWRIFLGEEHELWSGDHDSIRLLDASGRTVDVWTY